MFETSFVTALMNRSSPPPIGVSRDAKRFNVYKNNVTLSLKEGMKANFPCVLRLVGDDFFDFLIVSYLEIYPPPSKLMFQLGEKFPAFIKTIKQAEDYPFLSDIAALEHCLRLSYHARDAVSLTAADFQAVAAENLGSCIITLHPSFHLLKSDTPFISIYKDCMGLKTLESLVFQPEYGFVYRDNFEVTVQKIDESTYNFLLNITHNIPLADCFDETSDVAVLLTFLMQSQITIGISS